MGKTGVAGVMAEKLLSITAAAAEALPAGLNYEKHSGTVLAPRAALGDNVASDPDTRNQRNGCSGPVRLSDLQGTLQTKHKQYKQHHSPPFCQNCTSQSQGWVGWMTGWGHGQCTTGSWENKT